MADAAPTLYRFGDYRLDMARFELTRCDERIHVEPRVLDLLTHLIRSRDRVVTKIELLDTIWGDRFVTEAALTSSLKAARKAIGDSGDEQRLIRTVHRRGYQFVAEVDELFGRPGSPGSGSSRGSAAEGGEGDGDRPVSLPAAVGTAGLATPAAPAMHRRRDTTSAAAQLPSALAPTSPGHETPRDDAASDVRETQAIRYCVANDGTRIAYAAVGAGQPLLKAANWLTHLDLEWSSPLWGHWLSGLGRNRRLVRYDERGCGMSDWNVTSFGFDDWVDDLATVVDAVGIDEAPLLGVSQGGAVAIAYAVRHPERVSRLVLAGAYARGRMVRARSDQERQAAKLDIDLARVGWMRSEPSFMQVFASQFLPDGTPEQWAEFTEFQRMTTSPENGVRFLEEFSRIDVSDLAPKVSCPTLIVHSRHDARVPVDQACELAATIPDSRLVLLDSRNHLLMADEPAWPEFLDHIDDFLSG